MPFITYVGPYDAVDVPELELTVSQGESIPVEDAFAARALLQTDNWKVSAPVKADKVDQ